MTRPFDAIEGPRGLPGIGSLPAFARDPLAFLERCRDEHGDLSRFDVFEHCIVHVAHPDLVEEVLLRRASSLHKDAIYAHMEPLLGKGSVTAEGDTWRRQRGLAAPSFVPRRVDRYAEAIVRHAVAYTDALVDGGRRDLLVDMTGVTQRIVLDTLFGGSDRAELEMIAHDIEVVMSEFARDLWTPRRAIPQSVRTPGRRRADRAIGRIDAVLADIVAERREHEPGEDLLSALLSARDEDGNGFDDRQLRDEVVTMFVAGQETSALALTYTLSLLAVNPPAADRVYTEIDTVLDGEAPSLDTVPHLPWTRAALDEAMRLIPPAWAIGRQTIEDIELGGYAIPRGTQLLMSQWVLHRDPRWFDDPLCYRPERWIEGLAERLPRMAYLPFGAGSRVCIGKHLATLVGVLVLATIVQRARIVPIGAVPPRLTPSITLRPRRGVPSLVAVRAPRRVSPLP